MGLFDKLFRGTPPDKHDLKARQALAPFKRPCWLPRVIDREGDPRASRFGGRPALMNSEPWPTCGACGEKMPLFAQLDLSQTPAPDSTPTSLRLGLLQLFCCTNGECDTDDLSAFAPNSERASFGWACC